MHVSRYKRLEAEVKSKLQNFIAKGKSMQHGKNINEKYTILIFFQLATNSRSGQSGSARKSSTETFLSWIPRRSRWYCQTISINITISIYYNHYNHHNDQIARQSRRKVNGELAKFNPANSQSRGQVIVSMTMMMMVMTMMVMVQVKVMMVTA